MSSEIRSNSHSIGAIFGINEGNFSQRKIIMTCSEPPYITEGKELIQKTRTHMHGNAHST